MNPTPTRRSQSSPFRLITVLRVENEGAHVGAYFLLFERAAHGDIIGLRGETHVRRSKRPWAGGGGAGGFVPFEDPDATVYTRSPSSRAKETFSKKNKNSLHGGKRHERAAPPRKTSRRNQITCPCGGLQQVGLGKQ